MPPRSLVAVAVTALALAGLTACATDAAPGSSESAAASAEGYPITITHALGETVIPAKPERVATVAWANQDVPLALGVVPVGIGSQAWGDEDGDGILPWDQEKFDELGATPIVYDETDGIDFEAVADSDPDVILAAYSGLEAEDYQTLSEIAPTVAYPETAWTTSWRDQITYNSTAMGMAAEGEQLIADLEQQIADASAQHSDLDGKTGAFFFINPADLSSVGVYTSGDPRTAFLTDLGLTEPESVKNLVGSQSFYGDVSAENIDTLDDVDIIVTYGDDTTLATLQADPLVGELAAVKRGTVVVVGNGDAFSAAVNPTALTIPWVMEDYLDKLSEAAAK